jgi:glycosyltransferase involved in cell wall biosynthesis
MDVPGDLRVVLVHDWLTGMRGGEKVLEVLCRRWPHAPLYTLIHRHGSVIPAIAARGPRTSFLQFLPQVHRYYRYLLPLMPLAARWKIPDCDVLISSSTCVAKAASPPAGVPHICYCNTPMRYAWHMRKSYFGEGRPGIKARLRDWMLERLRRWDLRTADRVTHFIANSMNVQRRILDCYARSSRVIYPPVDTDYYSPSAVPREDFYLVMSALVPYKKVDLAIAACTRLRRPLVIIGHGQEEKRLRAMAGVNVHFLGWQPDGVVRDHYRRCRALLFPGEEDFGIVPVEAQACGAPVIAYGQGGATETVVPPHASSEPTGLWFAEQTEDSLVAAMEQFERSSEIFHTAATRQNALRFNTRRFEAELFGYINEVVSQPKTRREAA